MKSFFRTGSFGHGTSIRGYSDVDYFAVIPREYLKRNSSTSLREVRNILDARFPYTGVRVKTPAVRVPFGTDASESTDVVPADFIKKDGDGNRIYDIPDKDGDWMRSSPDALNSWVNEINKKLRFKVKPLIRFIKAWKYFKNVPISSFYLELRATKYASTQHYIVYSIDVTSVLAELSKIKLASMRDPMNISGYIDPCTSESAKQDALSKIETALSRVRKAIKAEKANKISTAFKWWDLLYNGYFPSYW